MRRFVSISGLITGQAGRRCCLASVVGIAAGITYSASAQCSGWLPISDPGAVTTDSKQLGLLTSLPFDPDGSGPQPEMLAIGGDFDVDRGCESWTNFALLGDDGYQMLGGAINGPVYAMVNYQGMLHIAGSFSKIINRDTYNISRWNGTSWDQNLNALNGAAYAMAVYNGELIVGGAFTNAGAVASPHIAVWNASSWHTLAGGADGDVWAATVFQGRLIAGGAFASIGGAPIADLAAWDGSAWTAIAAGIDGTVRDMQVHDGLLYVRGTFEHIGGISAHNLARWDGATWENLGDGIPTPITAFGFYNDDLIVSGEFTTAGSSAAKKIARRDGADWLPMGVGLGAAANALANSNDQLLTLTTNMSRYTQTRWDGASWRTASDGFSNSVLDVAIYRGTIAAAGSCTLPSGEVAYVTLGEAADRTPLPQLTRTPGKIREYNGQLFAVGDNLDIGADEKFGVIRWDGSKWQGVLATTKWIYALTLHDGRMYAGGENVLGYWDGATWTDITTPATFDVRAIAFYKGNLVVASGWEAYLLDGVSWKRFGEFENYISSMYVFGDDLIAGGTFRSVDGVSTGHIARWDGTAWSAMGAGLFGYQVNELGTYNGQLLAGGDVQLKLTGNSYPVVKWDGTSWQAFDAGFSGRCTAMLEHDGELILGGDFCISGSSNNHFARWTSDGIPWLASQPLSTQTSDGGDAEFSLKVAEGYEKFEAITYQWRRDGVAIADGPGGASAGGGTVLGSGTPNLKIIGIHESDLGSYDCIITAPCGQIASWPAALQFPCAADFDGTGFVDTDDFDAFVHAFESGDASADFDGSGFVDTDDFDAFVHAFEQGC